MEIAGEKDQCVDAWNKRDAHIQSQASHCTNYSKCGVGNTAQCVGEDQTFFPLMNNNSDIFLKRVNIF